MQTFKRIEQELRALRNPEKAAILLRFFKTGPGEYGEGDKFIGVVVPDVRSVARKNRFATLQDVDVLLSSEWHEVRECGLLILVEQCRKEVPAGILDFYLGHTQRINNWDLVDLSCPYIVGKYLYSNGLAMPLLERLAESDWLWDQRIAIVSTLTLIRNDVLAPTYSLAEKLLFHPHDLMHKATGWMLREAGKRGQAALEAFLDRFAAVMPRTTLRYAIERFPEPLRQHYLKLK